MGPNKQWRLTFLVEDTVHRPGLLAEHGLSALVEWERESILFDTGQTDLFLHNAEKIGLDLNRVSRVALSHGHYDHTGGLLRLLQYAHGATLFAHPMIFCHKFVREKKRGWREIGIPFSRDQVEQSCPDLRLDAAVQEIVPGVFLSGEIPRKTDFEEAEPAFFADAGGRREADSVPDDQALILDTSSGLVVILGCAHAGVINTLQHIRQLLPRRPVAIVAGGMHLLNAPAERILRTVEALRELDVAQIVAGHCTGWKACCSLSREFDHRFSYLSVGTILEQGSAR